MDWLDELRYDSAGLVPVVAQEATTGEVLMVAYADREALRLTLESGFAHYHSRSRGRLWKKGESSGNVQRITEVRIDCDGDSVLYRVRQTGPACHTLEPTCFYRAAGEDGSAPAGTGGHVLTRLEETVRERDEVRPEGSYTSYLFGEGVDKILKKLGEETTEVVIAAKNESSPELRGEVADLLFHLAVLLRARRLPLSEVWDELEGRYGRTSRIPGRRVDRST